MIPDPYIRDQTGPGALVEGYYLIQRRRQNRVALPVRVWFGPPADPETGEDLDRSPRWQIAIAGQLINENENWDAMRVGNQTIGSLDEFWPACTRSPIDADEYRYRLERAAWAGEHDPNDPFGDTAARIDPMRATLPFSEPMEAIPCPSNV